jgi:hypothetical protein
MLGHRCKDHIIDPSTETLIVGTFNPDSDKNTADFFYGRPRNAMWDFLPRSKGESSLKGRTKEEKLAFARRHRIDFIDLISEVGELPENYDDRLLDCQKNIVWKDVIAEVAKLTSLKRIGVSRKSFTDVPNIGSRVKMIGDYAANHQILFRCVHSPSRAHKRGWPDWEAFLGASL